MANHYEHVPFWPEQICVRENPLKTCSFMGITADCQDPITYGSPFTEGTELAHWCLFSFSLIVGFLALTHIERPWQWKDSMKVTTALYMFETGFFAFGRVAFGVGRPMVIVAALHNLFEWSLVLHCADEIRSFQQFKSAMGWVLVYIFGVISFCLMIPDLLVAFIFEQAAGILLDIGLPMMFFYQVFFSPSKEVRQFYLRPAIAHSVHVVLTIIPLVLGIFFVGATSYATSFVLEFIIYLSFPITHILYIVWSYDVDALRCPQSDPEKGSQQEDESFMLDVEAYEEGLLPARYRVKHTPRYLGVGLILGLVFLLGIPAFLGVCDQPASDCVFQGPITATAVARVNRNKEEEFLHLMATKDLLGKAKNAAGNVEFKLIKSVSKPRDFLLVSTWKTVAQYEAWMDDDSEQARIFGSPKVKETLAGGKLRDVSSFTIPDAACQSSGALSIE